MSWFERLVSAADGQFIPWSMEMILRGSLIMLGAWILLRFLSRGAPAALRARGHALIFTALLVLPLLVMCEIRWEVLPQSVLSSSKSDRLPIALDTSVYVGSASETPSQGTVPGAEWLGHAVAERPSDVSWPHALMALYAAGVFVGFMPILLTRVALRRWRRQSDRLTEARILRLLGQAKTMVQCRRPVDVRLSAVSSMPMTWGLRRGVILLPKECLSWSDERVRLVLAHECAHVARRDVAVGWVAHLIRALYWPQPLVWWLVRNWRVEAERACDARVLHGGASPTDYATALHELARWHRSRKVSLVGALPMAQGTSELEERVRRVLSPSALLRQRRRLKGGTALVMMGLCLAVGVLAQGNGPDGEEAPAGTSTTPENQEAPVETNARYFNFLIGLIIPELSLDGVSLQEAVETLRALAAEHDARNLPPDEKGASIVLRSDQLKQVQPDALNQRITMDLQSIPLMEAIRYVTALAGVAFEVETDRVVIVPTEEARKTLLYTKSYRIRQDVLGEGRKAKDVLADLGVPFEGEATAFYDKSRRHLIVRHHQEGMAAVDRVVASLNAQPAFGFIIHSPKQDRHTIVNQSIVDQEFAPYSTYKIPNAILALEQGLIADLDTEFSYDADRHPEQEWWPKSWTRAHDLRSAFKYSVVWFFKDLAVQMRAPDLAEQLRQWDYGNGSVPNLNDYWLGKGLMISPRQQVQFLRRLNEEKLGVSPETTRKLKEIAFVEERNGKRLYAKTGTGDYRPELWVAWYVGWVEMPAADPHYFAILCVEPGFAAARKKRQEVIDTVFAEIGF